MNALKILILIVASVTSIIFLGLLLALLIQTGITSIFSVNSVISWGLSLVFSYIITISLSILVAFYFMGRFIENLGKAS